MSKSEQACRHCHAITDDDECPACHSDDLSDDFLGYVIIMDTERSVIAGKMGIEAPGTYALKVR